MNTLHDFGSIQEVKLLQDTTEEKSDKVEELKGGNGDSQSDSAAFLKYNEAVARFGLSLKVVSTCSLLSYWLFVIKIDYKQLY